MGFIDIYKCKKCGHTEHIIIGVEGIDKKGDLEILKIEHIQKEDIIGIELINPEGKSIGFVNNPGYIE